MEKELSGRPAAASAISLLGIPSGVTIPLFQKRANRRKGSANVHVLAAVWRRAPRRTRAGRSDHRSLEAATTTRGRRRERARVPCARIFNACAHRRSSKKSRANRRSCYQLAALRAIMEGGFSDEGWGGANDGAYIPSSRTPPDPGRKHLGTRSSCASSLSTRVPHFASPVSSSAGEAGAKDALLPWSAE